MSQCHDSKTDELLTNIQYAIQRHYFGALAETYFDNKTREALFQKTGRIIIIIAKCVA